MAQTLRQFRRKAEQQYCAAVVEAHAGNLTAAAEEAGLAREAFSRKLKDLALTVERRAVVTCHDEDADTQTTAVGASHLSRAPASSAKPGRRGSPAFGE